MKGKSPNWMEATYGPVKKKTFPAAIMRLLEKEFPQLAGDLTRRALAQKIQSLADTYYPASSHMRPGQMLWIAVDEKETGGYGKSIEKTAMKPVVLDCIRLEDIEALLAGENKRERRKHIAVRLFTQAKDQGGVLTTADVATIFRMSPATISRYIREWERDNGQLVPRRGTVHDMGPSITHKRQICYKVVVEGKSISTAARESNHSPEAVTRYVKDYKRICTCLKEGLSLRDARYVTNMSKKLSEEYLDLFEEFGDDFDVY